MPALSPRSCGFGFCQRSNSTLLFLKELIILFLFFIKKQRAVPTPQSQNHTQAMLHNTSYNTSLFWLPFRAFYYFGRSYNWYYVKYPTYPMLTSVTEQYLELNRNILIGIFFHCFLKMPRRF